MPHASILILTVPGPGPGMARSTSSNGPFGLETCTHRIVAIPPFSLIDANRGVDLRIP